MDSSNFTQIFFLSQLLLACVFAAMKILKGTIADFPATEDLVKVIIKVAPIVAAFFGMPAV